MICARRVVELSFSSWSHSELEAVVLKMAQSLFNGLLVLVVVFLGRTGVEAFVAAPSTFSVGGSRGSRAAMDAFSDLIDSVGVRAASGADMLTACWIVVASEQDGCFVERWS